MPRTYKPRIRAGEDRPKSGGRRKGSLEKSTVAIREAVLSVFADMQARTGRENGHFLDWALGDAPGLRPAPADQPCGVRAGCAGRSPGTCPRFPRVFTQKPFAGGVVDPAVEHLAPPPPFC